MKPLILTALLLSAPLSVHAVDLDLLTDVICAWETRGERFPDDFIGPAGEIGRCAVRSVTARDVGYTGRFEDIHGEGSEKKNRAVAKLVLLYCADRVENTAFRLAYCYNAGPWRRLHRDSDWFRYAKQIATTYANLWAAKHGPGIKLARR